MRFMYLKPLYHVLFGYHNAHFKKVHCSTEKIGVDSELSEWWFYLLTFTVRPTFLYCPILVWISNTSSETMLRVGSLCLFRVSPVMGPLHQMYHSPPLMPGLQLCSPWTPPLHLPLLHHHHPLPLLPPPPKQRVHLTLAPSKQWQKELPIQFQPHYRRSKSNVFTMEMIKSFG